MLYNGLLRCLSPLQISRVQLQVANPEIALARNHVICSLCKSLRLIYALLEHLAFLNEVRVSTANYAVKLNEG